MINRLQISQMSREEKLQALEAIWADLSKDDALVESPEWHRDVLIETEAREAGGQENIMDWQTAKRELRKRFE
jgi:phosphoribosylanthranilate isomerase